MGFKAEDVLSCVRGITATYRECSTLLERVRLQRAEKQIQPPPHLLEDNVEQARQEIEKELERGRARFGEAFEEGDSQAVPALHQISVQLQRDLQDKLQKAAFQDGDTDFGSMIDAADLGRDKTIATLLELRQKLLQNATGNGISTSSSTLHLAPPTPPKDNQLPFRSTPTPTADRSPSPTSTRHHRWSLAHRSRDVSTEGDAGSGAEQSQDRRHRHSTLRGIFSRHRASSGSNELLEGDFDDSHRRPTVTSEPSDPGNLSGVPEYSASPRNMEKPKFAFKEGEANPFDQSRASSSSHLDVPDAAPTSPGSIVRTLSNTPSSAPSKNSLSIPHPSPDNNYLGFCRSAWRLQTGDKKGALTKKSEFNDGWSQSTVYYLACTNSKCAFAGHIDVEVIWTKSWNVPDKGLKFRWPFLAKSHVCQSKVKDHHFSYQCLFCVFAGNPGPVIHGTDLYMEHVNMEHRGRALGDVVLYVTNCIQDRVADDAEDWDINLFPLTEIESAQLRKRSLVLSDELLDGGPQKQNVTDGEDEMFANEPWNADLSDFHMSDGWSLCSPHTRNQ